MVFIKVGSVKKKISYEGGMALQMKNPRTDGDVDHQQDHDLQDAYGACLLVHDRPKRGLGVFVSLRTG